MKHYSFLIFQFVFAAAAFANASFNCDKAVSKIEKVICSEDDLRDLDYSLGKFYSNSLSKLEKEPREALQEDQRQWLSSRNSHCQKAKDTADCMKPLYKDRILNLNRKYYFLIRNAFYINSCDWNSGTDYDLYGCYARSLEIAKKYNGEVFSRILDYVNGKKDESLPTSEYLKEDQRKWLDYAESSCWHFSFQGGQLAGFYRDQCLLYKYNERLSELLRYPCDYNDENCPKSLNSLL